MGFIKDEGEQSLENTFAAKSSESLSDSMSESENRESESLEASSRCGEKLREREKRM